MDRLGNIFEWMKSPAGLEARAVSLAKSRKVQSKNTRKRYANNEGFRVRSKFYGMLYQVMRRPIRKDKPTLFGCSQWELRAHVQSLFKSGMTWLNYGSFWEMDHVCPVGRFNLPAEILSCFHYTNLRPRLKILNRLDGKLFQQRLTHGRPFRNQPTP